jgi:hypothetical protein
MVSWILQSKSLSNERDSLPVSALYYKYCSWIDIFKENIA